MSADLIARLRAGNGEDRELDEAIYKWSWRELNDPHDRQWLYENYTAPAFTTSFDACLALKERVLPGWRVDAMGENGDGTAYALLFERTKPVLCNDAPTLCRALLIAMLEAHGKEAK